jgi:glyoxylate reductase
LRRVQVVDKLLPFVEAADIPSSIDITIFNEADGVIVGDFDGVVPVVTTRIGAVEMDRLRGLKVIANYGVGVDNIDLAAARERGIGVSNTPGVLTDATAELTWALILATARRVGEGERLVRNGEWTGWTPTQLRGTGLTGKTLGVVGMGRIGRAVGERAKAFGMRVKYWGRTRPVDWEGEIVELDELIRTCDVVTIHLSKSPETENLIDASLLKDGAILINTARGSIVDEEVLVRELVSGRIRAGLDVYAEEPTIPEALLPLDNVVLLPHIGSATHEARQAMWDMAWANLVAGIDDRALVNPVVL